MNNQYDSLLDALVQLRKKGYTCSFNIKPNGLYCPEKDETFTPEEVDIVEFHRFEGNTDFSDMSVLYVLQTTNNCKGVLIDAYGTYSNAAVGQFLRKIDFVSDNEGVTQLAG